jgi:hypothetical protein
MGGDSVLATITHILVDEVHERNRFTDFLLIALRDSLAKFRSLHLILMSATIDTLIFTKYFNNCRVLTGNVYVIGHCHIFFIKNSVGTRNTRVTPKVMHKIFFFLIQFSF